jgi:hypothetical protein
MTFDEFQEEIEFLYGSILRFRAESVLLTPHNILYLAGDDGVVYGFIRGE